MSIDDQMKKDIYLADEREDQTTLNDSLLQHSSKKVFDDLKDSKSSYYAEDENSRICDTPLNENVESATSCSPESGNVSLVEQHYNDISQSLNNDSSIQIQKGPCTKCGSLIYLDLQPSKKPICVQCLSKETGHDECTKDNCSTCKELAHLVTKIGYCREKVLDIQREEVFLQNSNMAISTDMLPNHSNGIEMGSKIQQRGLNCEISKFLGAVTESDKIPFLNNTKTNKYSFEEDRYYRYESVPFYKQQRNPMYSSSLSSSYRQAVEQGYDTDSSFGQSSVSSGGGEYNYSDSIIERKHQICKLCKVTIPIESVDKLRRKYSISICDICSRGHQDCTKEGCETCMHIAEECFPKSAYIQHSYIHRRNKNSRRIGKLYLYCE